MSHVRSAFIVLISSIRHLVESITAEFLPQQAKSLQVLQSY